MKNQIDSDLQNTEYKFYTGHGFMFSYLRTNNTNSDKKCIASLNELRTIFGSVESPDTFQLKLGVTHRLSHRTQCNTTAFCNRRHCSP